MTLPPTFERARVMLLGCPDGATEYALAQHGFDRATLDAMTVAGLLRTSLDHYKHGLIVTRFHARG